MFKFYNATSKKSTYFQQLEPSTLQVEILASNSQQFFMKKQVGERRGNKSRGPAGLSFASETILLTARQKEHGKTRRSVDSVASSRENLERTGNI